MSKEVEEICLNIKVDSDKYEISSKLASEEFLEKEPNNSSDSTNNTATSFATQTLIDREHQNRNCNIISPRDLVSRFPILRKMYVYGGYIVIKFDGNRYYILDYMKYVNRDKTKDSKYFSPHTLFTYADSSDIIGWKNMDYKVLWDMIFYHINSNGKYTDAIEIIKRLSNQADKDIVINNIKILQNKETNEKFNDLVLYVRSFIEFIIKEDAKYRKKQCSIM